MPQTYLPHNHGQGTEKVLSQLPNTEDFQIVSELSRQLSDCSRIRIFWLLFHCEECVINISAIMGMSNPAISYHLKQLKSKGLIVSRRNGKEVYYKSANTKQTLLLHDMIEGFLTISCPTTKS